LSFIDDKTHFTWVYFLKRKDEVFERFVEWKTMVEKKSGEMLKVLHTDNGGEFTSSESQAYLNKEGVCHELTVPKTSEQNGTAECMNQTLVEASRSMLYHGSLPPKCWAEALSTAVYLRNWSPTKAVCHMTPQEAWTREKPSVDHLRTFGCHSFVHISKDERMKLGSKFKKCVFLEYGSTSKGYRVYDPVKKKVFLSRDVAFNKSKFGIQSSDPEPESQKYVCIDYVDDSLEQETTTMEENPTVVESSDTSPVPAVHQLQRE